MPTQIAKWNPARDVWETDQVVICGHSDVFSETWPTSGMTHAGTAYELPTWAHHTDDSVSSLLRNSEALGRTTRGSSGDLMLPSAVQLLPTPTTTDHKASGSAGYETGHSGTTLTDATVRQPDRWGKYADAIARWEHLTREAPAPTEPARNDNPRLSPAFTEWLMGLPAGWITDVPGITRNEALRLCGNGVAPQQAAAALSFLLSLEEVA